jgi:NitT/TauT family transport system substrate-binding protein
MQRILKVLGLAASLVILAVGASASAENLRVGWCTKAVTSATSPWAIAMKLGWLDKAGLGITVIPTGGMSDCMRLVATRDYFLAL